MKMVILVVPFVYFLVFISRLKRKDIVLFFIDGQLDRLLIEQRIRSNRLGHFDLYDIME